jgi:hypothetical protein
MMPEIWAGVAVVLLGLAAMAGGLVVFKTGRRWEPIAIGARAAATAVLIVALGLAVVRQGEWTPFDLRQMVLALVVAMLLIHMGLAWRLRIGSAGPVVDVVALLLILIAIAMIQPGAPLLRCVQRALPFQVQWVLYVLGGAAILVAGSAGLVLVLHKATVSRGRVSNLPRLASLYDLLTQATYLALVALGSGLTVSVWWAWRTVGAWPGADPRETWMAITWLLAAMSLLAWRLEGRRGRWVVGLTEVAAASVLFGLLILADLQRILGM